MHVNAFFAYAFISKNPIKIFNITNLIQIYAYLY